MTCLIPVFLSVSIILSKMPLPNRIFQELKQGYLAEQHALIAAKNVRLLIRGVNENRLATYNPASAAMAIVSLGRRDAVAQIFFITMAGRIPGMIKSGDLFVGKTRKQLGLKP